MLEPEPIWDIAHLAHVELLTPKLDENARIFTDIMEMSVRQSTGIRHTCGRMMIRT